MKIKPSSMYECMHLDPNYLALTVQNLITVSESFHLLDIHGDGLLNDLQTKIWMKHNTSLKYRQVVALFELIDIQATGFLDFDMFYFFNAIMLAVKDKNEKEFVNRHARSLYSLFEVRMKKKMTHEQFEMSGWIFGFNHKIVKQFHKEFDISVYKRTAFDEFKLFVLICMELQSIQDKRERIVAHRDYRQRLIHSLNPELVEYLKFDNNAHQSYNSKLLIMTRVLLLPEQVEPEPRKICRNLRWTQRPYLKRGRDVRRLNPFQRFHKYIFRRFRILSEKRLHHLKVLQLCLRVCSGGHCFKREEQQRKDAPPDLMQGTLLKRRRRRCCKKRTKRKRSHWGEDDSLLLDNDKSKEVDEASRMPSWVQRLDKIKKAKRAKERTNILSSVFANFNPFTENKKSMQKVEPAEETEEDEPEPEPEPENVVQPPRKEHHHKRHHQARQSGSKDGDRAGSGAGAQINGKREQQRHHKHRSDQEGGPPPDEQQPGHHPHHRKTGNRGESGETK